MRELLGRVIATQEAHGREIALVREDVKALGLKVEQHRTGWRVFMWLGGAALAVFAAFNGFSKT